MIAGTEGQDELIQSKKEINQGKMVDVNHHYCSFKLSCVAGN